MAKISSDVINTLKKYVAELEKNNFHIKKAILFGSCVNGNFSKFSDIDVALVSDDFEGVRFLDKEKIRKITLKVDHRLSPLPYKTEDFVPDDLFINEIISTGKRIV